MALIKILPCLKSHQEQRPQSMTLSVPNNQALHYLYDFNFLNLLSLSFHSRRVDFLARPWTYGACLVPGTAYSLACWAGSFPFIAFSKPAFTYLFFNEALLDHTISNDKWPVCQPLAPLSSRIQLCGIFFHSSSWFITSQIIYLFIYTYVHTLHMQPYLYLFTVRYGFVILL